MTDFYACSPDFIAEITILTFSQGGRRTTTHSYLSWDFRYADDNPDYEIYMIYPSVLNKFGNQLPKCNVLDGTFIAEMRFLVYPMPKYHSGRIAVGTEFYCVEGRDISTNGRVLERVELRACPDETRFPVA